MRELIEPLSQGAAQVGHLEIGAEKFETRSDSRVQHNFGNIAERPVSVSFNTTSLVTRGILPDLTIGDVKSKSAGSDSLTATMPNIPADKGEGGVAAVATKLYEGAINEIYQHPLKVAGNIAAGAGIAALSTAFSPAVLVGAGAIGVGLMARGISNSAGELFRAAQTVASPKGATPEALAAAEETLRRTGGEGVNLIAGIAGGGSSLAIRSLGSGFRAGVLRAGSRGASLPHYGELAYPGQVAAESASAAGAAVSSGSASPLVELSLPAARGMRVFNASREGSQASDTFIRNSLEGLKVLAKDDASQIASNKVRIVFGRRLADIFPDSVSPSCYASDIKTIFLPEIKGGTVALTKGWNSDGAIAVHEAAHAVDHARRWISQSDSFTKAHMADISADTKRRLYEYLVNGKQVNRQLSGADASQASPGPWTSTPRGRQEAFATLYQHFNHGNPFVASVTINQWKNTSKWLIENGFVDPKNISPEIRRQLLPVLEKALASRKQ